MTRMLKTKWGIFKEGKAIQTVKRFYNRKYPGIYDRVYIALPACDMSNCSKKESEDAMLLVASAPEMYAFLQHIYMSTADADLATKIRAFLRKVRGRK